MKKIVSLIILSLFVVQAFAQHKQHILNDATYKLDANNLVIHYTLKGHTAKPALFNVSLLVLDSESFRRYVPINVSGDINKKVTEGDKTITWDLAKEGLTLSSHLNVIITIDTVVLGKGPIYAIFDIVPGLGHAFVNTGGSKAWGIPIGLASVGCIAYGFIEKGTSNSYYAKYHSSYFQSDIDDNYNAAEKHYKNYQTFTMIGCAIWAADMAYVIYKGSRNAKLRQQYYTPVSLSPVILNNNMAGNSYAQGVTISYKF